MKKTTTLLLILLCFSTAFAQTPTEKELKKHHDKVAKSKAKGTVVLSLDTLFNSGTAYAILKSKRKMMVTDYTLFSLTGTELVDIPWECTDDNKDCYFAFLFLQTGGRAEIKNYLGLSLEDIIVENELIKDNAIDPLSEKKFLMKNPPKYSNKQQQPIINIQVNGGNANTNTYQTVDRNRNSTIQTFGSDIKQDFKVIGTFSKTTNAGNGKILHVISFYLPNGTKVAEATQEDINSKSYKVVTIKDNRTNYVTTNFLGQEARDIAKYLSDNYYL